MYLRFLRSSFPGLMAHFFFALSNNPVSTCTPIYPVTCWKASLLSPSLGNCGQSCCKRGVQVFVDVSLQLLWVNTQECNCWIIWYIGVVLQETTKLNLEKDYTILAPKYKIAQIATTYLVAINEFLLPHILASIWCCQYSGFLATLIGVKWAVSLCSNFTVPW